MTCWPKGKPCPSSSESDAVAADCCAGATDGAALGLCGNQNFTGCSSSMSSDGSTPSTRRLLDRRGDADFLTARPSQDGRVIAEE